MVRALTITLTGERRHAHLEALGDVVYLNVAGQPVIALNTLKAVEDLIVKNSAVFSGRPRFPMVYNLCVTQQTVPGISITRLRSVDWKYGVVLLSLGPRFTAYRKLYHQWLGPLAVAHWDQHIEAEIRDCVGRALRGNRDFLSEFNLWVPRITSNHSALTVTSEARWRA